MPPNIDQANIWLQMPGSPRSKRKASNPNISEEMLMTLKSMNY
jgi:hypothetical protein